MDLILGGILLIAGAVALMRGRFSFSRDSVAIGPPARIAGGVLMAALPLAFIVSVVLSALARSGTNVIPDIYRGAVSYVVMVLCVIAAVIVAKRGIP